MDHVNIGADNADDAFYRYKMPKLQAKIEGRGNGIKTNIVNMVDVAKALGRPPSYTTKYFGCVLGAQSKFDEKSGTSTVNGAHDTNKLVQHLEGFIKKYVQCYGCHNPETEIIITKNQLINMKCAACGFVSEVDMRDKLTTFILNNPPETKKKKGDKNMRRAEKERLKAGEALDEEAKKSKKESKKKSSSADVKKKKKGTDEDLAEKGSESPDSGHKEQVEDDGDDDDNDVEWQTDTSASAAKQRIEEQLTAITAGMVMVSTADDEAVTPKSPPMNGSANGKSDLNGTAFPEQEEEEEEEDVEESEHEKLVAELVDYIQTHKVAEVAEYVGKKVLDQELFIALVEAIFHNTGKGFSKEVVKKKAVFEAAAKDEGLQAKLLNGLEHFFALKAGGAAKEVALVLKVGLLEMFV